MRLIYEDINLIVIDKPAGLVVHASGSDTTESVASLLKDKIDDSDPERPGIVHRLDKNTSGVMIVAKNSAAKSYLQKQFRQRKAGKRYLALVVGRPKLNEAILNWPIARNTKNPLKRAVRAGGKAAITQYKVIKKYPGFSLLEARPKTGRTHQIRVHLAHLGHPVVGDELYGKPDSALKRQFLHATELKIKLPSGQVKTFKSSLPADLQNYLNAL